MKEEDEIASTSNSNEALSDNESDNNGGGEEEENNDKARDKSEYNVNKTNNDAHDDQANDIFRKDGGELDELKLVGSVLKTAQEKEAREKKQKEKAEAAAAKALEKEAKEKEKAAAKAAAAASMHQPRQLRARTAAADAAAALAAKAVADKIEMEEKAAAARNRKIGRPRKKSISSKKDDEENTDKSTSSTSSKKSWTKGGKKRKESDNSSESESESEGEDDDDDEEVEDEDEAWKPGADSKKKPKKGSASPKTKTKLESALKPPKKKKRKRGKGYGKRGRPPKGWKPPEELQSSSPKGGAKTAEEKEDENSQKGTKNDVHDDVEEAAEVATVAEEAGEPLVVEKKRVGRPRKNKGKNTSQAGGGSQKKRKLDNESSESNNPEEGIGSTEDHRNVSSEMDSEAARNESLVAAALATVEKQSSTTTQGRKSPRLNKNDVLSSTPTTAATRRGRREDVDSSDVVVIVPSSPDDECNLAAKVVRGSESPPSAGSGETSSLMRSKKPSTKGEDKNAVIEKSTNESNDESSLEKTERSAKEDAVETTVGGSGEKSKPTQNDDKKTSAVDEVERPSLDNSDVVFVAVSQPASDCVADQKNEEGSDCSDKNSEKKKSAPADVSEPKVSIRSDKSSEKLTDAPAFSSSEVSSSNRGKLRRSTRRGVVTPPYPSPAPTSVPRSETNCDKETVDSSPTEPMEVDEKTPKKATSDVDQSVEEGSQSLLTHTSPLPASNTLDNSETSVSTEETNQRGKGGDTEQSSSAPLDTEVTEKTEDSTLDDSSASGDPKDILFRGICKRKNKRNKTCPICRGVFASNGFYMHMTKCRKYQGWTCGFCQLKGVYSFAPHMPGPGPDGPNTLCPDCSRSWKAEMKLAMENGSAPEEVEKLVSKVKTKSQSNSLDVRAEKSSDETVSEKADVKIESDTSTRTKRKVIAPSRYSDEDYKGVDDEGDANDSKSSPSQSGRNTNRSGGSKVSDSSSTHNNTTCSGQSSHAQLSAAIKSSEGNENGVIGGASTEFSSEKNDSTGWSIAEECALMIAALDNPQFMARRGPGLWMLDNGLDIPMEGKYTAREIVEHWDIMIKRCIGTSYRCLADTPAKYRATHVQSACMASELILAQNVALTFAGWLKIPPDIVDSSQLGQKLRIAKKGKSKGRWHRPSVTTRILSKLSVDDYVSSSLSIQKAWEEHTEELRHGIEEAIAPGQLLSRKSEDHVMTSPSRKCLSVHKKGEVSGAMYKHNSAAMEHVWGDSVKIAGKNLVVPAHVHTMMKKRALFTREGDPRPTLLCSWCGPKWTQKKKKTFSEKAGKKSKESTVPHCPACKLLYDDGWKMRGSSLCADAKSTTDYRDYTYTDPSGSIHRSVKAFLTATTKYIAKKFGNNGDDSHSDSGSDGEGGNVDDIDDDVGENDDASVGGSFDEIYEVRLPSIQQLYNEREGLMGVLKADEFCAMNKCFGSDSNIALMVLQSLATGKLPGWVQYETPFLRSEEELALLSIIPPTRFLGVTRLMEERQIADGGRVRIESFPTGRFGVEFPVFIVDHDIFGSTVESRSSSEDAKGRPLPRCATMGGRKVFLRTDIPREDIAGQLFSFIYRILYGRQAADDVRAQTNALHSRAGFVIDTLRAFGASKVDLKK